MKQYAYIRVSTKEQNIDRYWHWSRIIFRRKIYTVIISLEGILNGQLIVGW